MPAGLSFVVGIAFLILLFRFREKERTRNLLRSMEKISRGRDEAVAASRLKSALLATINHEVRTPVNVISGVRQLIADHMAERGDHSQDELLQSIDQACDRLVRTIQQVLDLASIVSGTFVVKPVRLKIWPVIHGEMEKARQPAAAKGLALRYEVDDPETEVVFDEDCLIGAVAILVDNAIKFTEAGSVMATLYRDPDGLVRLEISDTGIGMAEAYAAHVFDALSRQDSSYTRRYEPTGLGLALAKRYLELNHARISVTSKEGSGSSFVIRLSSTVPTVMIATSRDETTRAGC